MKFSTLIGSGLLPLLLRRGTIFPQAYDPALSPGAAALSNGSGGTAVDVLENRTKKTANFINFFSYSCLQRDPFRETAEERQLIPQSAGRVDQPDDQSDHRHDPDTNH